jgi:hypothetical protein
VAAYHTTDQHTVEDSREKIRRMSYSGRITSQGDGCEHFRSCPRTHVFTVSLVKCIDLLWMPLFLLGSLLEVSLTTMSFLSRYEREANQTAMGQRIGEKKLRRATLNT